MSATKKGIAKIAVQAVMLAVFCLGALFMSNDKPWVNITLTISGAFSAVLPDFLSTIAYYFELQNRSPRLIFLSIGSLFFTVFLCTLFGVGQAKNWPKALNLFFIFFGVIAPFIVLKVIRYKTREKRDIENFSREEGRRVHAALTRRELSASPATEPTSIVSEPSVDLPESTAAPPPGSAPPNQTPDSSSDSSVPPIVTTGEIKSSLLADPQTNDSHVEGSSQVSGKLSVREQSSLVAATATPGVEESAASGQATSISSMTEVLQPPTPTIFSAGAPSSSKAEGALDVVPAKSEQDESMLHEERSDYSAASGPS